jgi:DNA-binding NarL/FixJ family response regulator
VLQLLAEGQPDKVIAHRLNISERAVRAQVSRCRTALHAVNRSHLVAIAAELKLLDSVIKGEPKS